MSAIPKKKIAVRALPPEKYAGHVGHLQARAQAAAEAREERRLQEERRRNPQPGDFIAGQGVYVGRMCTLALEGIENVKKIFNIYAAPEDLPDDLGARGCFTYNEAVAHVAALKGWHGFDGASYRSATDFYGALSAGEYAGGWVIPTRLILGGGIYSHLGEDTLFRHRNAGALKDTFSAAAPQGELSPGSYWSSSEHFGKPGDMWGASFADGAERTDQADGPRMSCRPVRLVPAV